MASRATRQRGIPLSELREVENIIRERVGSKIKTKEEGYTRRYRILAEQLNRILEDFTSSLDMRLEELSATNRTVVANMAALAKNATLSRTELLGKVQEDIIRPLKRVEVGLRQIRSLQEATVEKVDKFCLLIQSSLAEFDFAVDAVDIYADFIERRSYKVAAGLLGEITIVPSEFENRYNSAKEPDTFLEFIGRIVEDMVTAELGERYARSTEELFRQCRERARSVEDLTTKAVQGARVVLEKEASVGLEGLVVRLNTLGMRDNPVFHELGRLLQEVLSLALAVEVEAPETSRDALIAELLQLCEDPRGVDRLVAIGLNLGFSEQQLRALSPGELCAMLTAEIFA